MKNKEHCGKGGRLLSSKIKGSGKKEKKEKGSGLVIPLLPCKFPVTLMEC